MKNKIGRILTIVALLVLAFAKAHGLTLAANFGGLAVLPAPNIPEPSTYATLAGLAVFGFVVIRRRRR